MHIVTYLSNCKVVSPFRISQHVAIGHKTKNIYYGGNPAQSHHFGIAPSCPKQTSEIETQSGWIKQKYKSN